MRTEGKPAGFSDPTALFAARDEIREQRRIPNPFIGKPFIEEPEIPTPKPTPFTQAQTQSSEDISDLTRRFQLNEQQDRIFALYLQGISPSAIAGLLGMGRINVLHSISNIRIKIGVPRKIPQKQAIEYIETIKKTEYCPPQNLTITDKQRAILELYLNGMPSREIGEALNITTKTANYHIKQIRKFFNVPNRLKKPNAINFIQKKISEEPNILD